MKIGFIDCDLLDGGTNFPNLALMKLSGYYKALGNDVEIITQYSPVDKVFCSKVFTATQEPKFLNLYFLENTPINRGGTGYDLQNAAPLPFEIEHHKPYYSIYDAYLQSLPENRKRKHSEYIDCSIGFTTRGCFRRCPFCVNANKTRVERWSPVSEFLDESRKYICLLDDNILAYPKWNEIFDELDATEKPFYYKQGVDIRLMTVKKAERFQTSKLHGDIKIAFDNINDAPIITRSLERFRANCSKPCKAYVLTGFYHKTGLQELESVKERLDILNRFRVLPYIMKHERFRTKELQHITTELARFCNQPAFYKKMTLETFVIKYGSKRSNEELKGVPKEILKISGIGIDF